VILFSGTMSCTLVTLHLTFFVTSGALLKIILIPKDYDNGMSKRIYTIVAFFN
jgi:hypothetical protein